METKTRTSFFSNWWNFKEYTEKKWFNILVILLLAIAAIYLGIHRLVDKKNGPSSNYEYSKLDEVQVQQINRIYFDSASIKAVYYLYDTSECGKKPQPQTASLDTNNKKPIPPSVYEAGCICRLLADKAINYLSNEFISQWELEQKVGIRNYLVSASPLEATSYLTNVRFKVRSNFWLVGPYVYWEIVFWSMFGVLASLLFNLGIVSKNSTTDLSNSKTVFDSSEIPYQIAKLLYAPLCTLVIVFGYNFFKDQNIVDIGSSKGVIVFAFIGGFYSARLIAFLDRLKEVVLPISGTDTINKTKSDLSKAIELEKVKIELQLDEATIIGDMRNKIAEMGLDGASIILENTQTGEKVSASKIEGDQATSFIVDKIKPGTYKLTATWGKEVLGEVVNLLGEQNVDLKNADATIIVMMKKID